MREERIVSLSPSIKRGGEEGREAEEPRERERIGGEVLKDARTIKAPLKPPRPKVGDGRERDLPITRRMIEDAILRKERFKLMTARAERVREIFDEAPGGVSWITWIAR